MRLALVVCIEPVPRAPGKVNDTTRHLLARDGYELELQKTGDVKVSSGGKLVGFVGHANVAYGEPAE